MLRHLLTLLCALHLTLAPIAQATAAHGGCDMLKGSFITSVVALGLTDVQTGIGDVFARAEIAAELAQLGMIDFFVPYTRIGAAVEVAGLGSGVLVKVGSKTFVRIGDRLHSFYHDESGAIRVPGVGGAPNRLPIPNDLPGNIHQGQQGKHIPGHNNFDPNRSPLNSNVNPDDLLSGVHSGQYPIVRTDPRGNPVVDFGSDIGSYVQQGQAGVPTRYGTVHYGKNGAHVVPANPNIN